MKTDIVQDEPKLILTYPHKTILNWIAFVTIISFSSIVTWILKNLIHEGTDESGRMIIVIALVCIPLLLCLLVCYFYLNAVKLEIDKNNSLKYYTYGSKGHSVLNFRFAMEDIQAIKGSKLPLGCSKVTMKIKNPIFCGFYEKKIDKQINVSVIAEREKVDFFIQEFLNQHSDKLQVLDVKKITVKKCSCIGSIFLQFEYNRGDVRGTDYGLYKVSSTKSSKNETIGNS